MSDENVATVWHLSVHKHMSIAQIAEHMGLTASAVHSLKHKGWSEILQHTVDSTDIYRLDLSEKLNQINSIWWDRAKTDIQAATLVVNCIDKLAKINGCHVTKIAGADGKPLQLIPENLMMLIATGQQPKTERTIE